MSKLNLKQEKQLIFIQITQLRSDLERAYFFKNFDKIKDIAGRLVTLHSEFYNVERQILEKIHNSHSYPTISTNGTLDIKVSEDSTLDIDRIDTGD